MQAKGLRDDTTCIVVDILPLEKNAPPLPPPKKKGVLKGMFRKKSAESSSNHDQEYMEPDVVEEMFEEGSADLSERLVSTNPQLVRLSCPCKMISLYWCDDLHLQIAHNVCDDSNNRHMACRLDTKYPLCNMFKLFMCAICQVEIKPGEGVSIHAGSTTRRTRPWDGPFLCQTCQEKREAMEGKRPSGGLLLPANYFSERCTLSGSC